jgi:oxalate decarboxylase/phosphoglucose isomerase-like protein (cupin superfamily)
LTPQAGDRGLAGGVLALRRGQNLTHNHFGNPRRLDARAFQRGLDGDGAEIVGRQGGKRAVETSDRGAGGTDDDDIV